MPTKKKPKKRAAPKRRAPKKKVAKKKKIAKKKVAKKPQVLSKKLEKYLDDSKARYNTVEHRTVYTAYDAAQTLKRPLSDVAKTLVILADRDVLIVVIPAHRRLDLKALKKVVNKDRDASELARAKKLKLTTERTIDSRLTNKPGAISPFGHLHKSRTYVDRLLTKPREIVINGGSFTLSIVMSPKEYVRVTMAVIGGISVARPKK